MLPNLVLAGFMGTGKTTLGEMIARRMQWDFIDTDDLIVAAAGMSISDIFALHGETAFRELEQAACLQAAGEPYRVIASGGGALLRAENREALERSGVIILLTCEPDVLLQRLEATARTGARPMLAGDAAGRITQLLEARQAVYSAVPLQVDTTHIEPAEAVERVMALYADEARNRMSPCIL